MIIPERRRILMSIAWLLPAFVVTKIFSQRTNSQKDGFKDAAQPFLKGCLTGNQFRKLTQPEKIAYVTGIWDGFMFSPALGGQTATDQRLYDCVPGLMQEQLLAIVEQYMKEHPGRWGDPMNMIVYLALPASCRVGAN